MKEESYYLKKLIFYALSISVLMGVMHFEILDFFIFASLVIISHYSLEIYFHYDYKKKYSEYISSGLELKEVLVTLFMGYFLLFSSFAIGKGLYLFYTYIFRLF